MGLDEEEAVVMDMRKKYKHNKKNKIKDLGEDSLILNEEVRKKKKHAVSGDSKPDSSLHEDGNEKGCEELDGDVQKEKDQKKKKKNKKKRKFEIGEENKKEKRDVCEAVENEKEKIHKKKKRKLKHEVDENVNEDSSDVESQMEGNNESKEKKKSKKEKKNMKHDVDENVNEDSSNVKSQMEENNGSKEKKKSKKEKKNMKHDVDEYVNEDSSNLESQMEGNNESKEKKSKKEKKNMKHDVDENVNEDSSNVESQMKGNNGSKEKKSKKEKKNMKQDEKNSGNLREESGSQKKRKKEKKKDENDSENPRSKTKKPKKVSFSGNVEVFPAEEELVRGKRFSKEEDEKVKEAVYNYIETHNLGEEGLSKVLNCSAHPELKNCWKEIGSAMPYRPFKSIYYRAHNLFERGKTRKWTKEEYEFLKKTQEKHGNNWKLIADELGKHRFHVKDAWRRIKLPNLKRGHWSQNEYQTLFDLVNTDLQMKISEEKKSKYGMLRDNICWGAISDKLSTRTNQNCCIKWYTQLSSPMVQQGIWADVDDYRLLDALYNLDACCYEDVDWDGLIEYRSGEVCRRRWDQMVLHIGQHGLKSFGEQVDILAKRYCPSLVEVREEWDSKPVVD